MGYTRRQRLLRVELPLAMPLIMAGIRLATVTTIGLATVAAILGESFGGFGFFITEGLNRFFLDRDPRRRRPVDRAWRSAPTSCSCASSVGSRPGPASGSGRLMGDIVGWFLDPANLDGPARHPESAVRAHRPLRRGPRDRHAHCTPDRAVHRPHASLRRRRDQRREHRPGAALVRARRHDPAGVAGARAREYGLDPIPTFIAMTALAIPAILIGAYAGLRSIDADLVEAARGMGFRERQILTGVEIPLASPIIVGGFRTATLQVIATATIGAIVSGGGLGRFIVDGIHNQDYTTVIGGVILVSGLAIGVDFVLAGVQRLVTPRGLRVAAARRAEPPEWPRRSRRRRPT